MLTITTVKCQEGEYEIWGSSWLLCYNQRRQDQYFVGFSPLTQWRHILLRGDVMPRRFEELDCDLTDVAPVQCT
jgi:hypothetical protein